jgi:aminoglycoside phosphotransferase (APT) family kinase protein
MEPSEVLRAVEAAKSTAAGLGLRVDDAIVVHNSNRIAVRLTPCDVLARVAPPTQQTADNDLELEVVRRLAEIGSPVAAPDPRVEPRTYVRDGFAITLWTYYGPIAPSYLAPAEYAETLFRLHASLREIDVPAPHFTDRIGEAEELVADPELSPELADVDRDLLGNTLIRLRTSITGRGAREQLLHGEPHMGNFLRTTDGLLLIDFETCCRGPVEFDVAHGLLPDEDGRMLSTDEVCRHYPGADRYVIDQCRTLILAMITAWRWRRDDQLPNGRHWRAEGLKRLRAELRNDAG